LFQGVLGVDALTTMPQVPQTVKLKVKLPTLETDIYVA